MRKVLSVALITGALVGGCEARKAPVVAAAPPKAETTRLPASVCEDTGRPRGFRVERAELAPVLAEEARTPPDWRRAYALAYGLARSGNSVAILHLSDLYGNSATGFADRAEQARLFGCAVKLGAPEAMVRQGLRLSQDGAGKPREARRADRAAAIALFERAANLGDLSGVNAVASLVAGGRQGWPASSALAREIREASAATGDADGLSAMAADAEAAGNLEGAFFWRDVLAAQPDAPADAAARRDSLARRLSATQVQRTLASTKRWRRLSWGEVQWRWVQARDRILAAD